jgi:DNA-binding NtrC family response regulator
LERSVILSLSQHLPEQWLPNEGFIPAQTAADNEIQAISPDQSLASEKSESRLDLQFPIDGSMGLEEMESEIVRKMLEICRGNVMEAARILKTTREKIRYRIEKYNLR